MLSYLSLYFSLLLLSLISLSLYLFFSILLSGQTPHHTCLILSVWMVHCLLMVSPLEEGDSFSSCHILILSLSLSFTLSPMSHGAFPPVVESSWIVDGQCLCDHDQPASLFLSQLSLSVSVVCLCLGLSIELINLINDSKNSPWKQLAVCDPRIEI